MSRASNGLPTPEDLIDERDRWPAMSAALRSVLSPPRPYPGELAVARFGRTILSTFGATEMEKPMSTELDERLAAKEREFIQAQQALSQLEQQRRGIQTHITRLEGAMTCLRELGAKPTGRLQLNEEHPSAPTPPAPEEVPAPEPEKAE